MAIVIEPQIFQRFRGIRELNGINSGGEISAIQCQNVEIIQTEVGSASGIKTMDGNAVLYELPADYNVIGIFKSVQEGTVYRFIYAENDVEGVLFYIDITRKPVKLIEGLSVTGECNGITLNSSAYDIFVFTNGEEVKTVCFTADLEYGEQIRSINPVDYLGRNLKFLSMAEWNGFLVVASQYGVHASHQNDIYTWNDDPQDVADSFYIDFSKKVTAVFAYTGGLYIFTADDVSLLNVTPNDTGSTLQTMAGVGCFSYTSIVKHDTYLFFYDNNQKNIYFIQNIDSGQLRPDGPVAREIQSRFNNVKKCKLASCIYDNRNEIWMLINDEIYIYNYFLKEFVQRKEQDINTVCLIDNLVLSGADKGRIFIENINIDFSGEFYPAVYQSTFINLGSNSNLKKQKTPLLIVLNDNYRNDFWVELTVNNKTKNPKKVKIKGSGGGVYGSKDDNEIIPDNQKFGTAVYAANNPYAKKVVEISTPQTWYTLGVKIYTNEIGQGFYIYSVELKNIKAKLKTRGR